MTLFTLSMQLAMQLWVVTTGNSERHSDVQAWVAKPSVLTTIEHAPGAHPRGIVLPGGAVAMATVQRESGARAELVRIDLKTGRQQVVAEQLDALQAPQWKHGRLVFVRAIDEHKSQYEVVSIDAAGAQEEVLGFTDRYVAPVLGTNELQYLTIDALGVHALSTLRDGTWHDDVVLSKGTFRSPVRVGAHWAVEQQAGTAGLVWVDGVVVDRVIWGSELRPNASATGFVYAHGKGGEAWEWSPAGGRKAIKTARVGVARPVVVTSSEVVVELDRGWSEPRSLCRVLAGGAGEVCWPQQADVTATVLTPVSEVK
jgi:hypothetical protein